jgi:serine phosphatase RsbU (regulator of sigma subunit)
VGILIDIGVAKTNKYASRESGDTVEVVERPTGGISVVIADGQGSGRAAKALSLMVTARAVSMLKDGVRDGAVARGVGDALFAMRGGQVSATLDILSADARSGALVATRNSSSPMLVGFAGSFELVAGTAEVLGVRYLGRPDVRSWPLEPGLWAMVGTDGIFGDEPGSGAAAMRDLARRLSADAEAQEVADAVLAAAIGRDGGKPRDDMSAAVVRIAAHEDEPRIRRMSVRLPLP